MAKSELMRIGFTDLESDLYLALLQKGVMTGYAVAKVLGKPVANVYKALESLAGKGAVVHAHREKKMFRAIPWRQLLDDEQRRHRRVIEELARELEAVPEPDDDEEVYQLKNIDQVIADALHIIRNAETVLLAEIEPGAVPLFAESLVAAAKRGVEVRVKVYRPVALDGVKVTLRENGEEVFARTKDVHFKLAADGRVFLNVLLNVSMDAVIQAFRSHSSLMNMAVYCGLLYELVLTELKPAIAAGNLKEARSILEKTAHLHPFSSKNSVLDVYARRYAGNPGELK